MIQRIKETGTPVWSKPEIEQYNCGWNNALDELEDELGIKIEDLEKYKQSIKSMITMSKAFESLAATGLPSPPKPLIITHGTYPIFFPKFEDKRLQKIANDCGLTIDGDEPAVSSREIEFFAEQLLREVSGNLDGLEEAS